MSGSDDQLGLRWALILDKLTSFWRIVGITAMWLVACLPVVTVGAATIALLAVVRDDALRQERPVVRSYLSYLRENFRLGTGLFILTGGPVLSLLLLQRQSGSLLPALTVIMVAAVVAALPLVVHGYVLLAHTRQSSIRGLYGSCLRLTLARPGAFILGLLLIAAASLAATLWPGSLLVLGYPVARALFGSFHHAFYSAGARGSGTALAGGEQVRGVG